jgi:DNA-directed RNA polymerase specialized sigma24 family protein
MRELHAALAESPADQSKALTLIGTSGVPYEEVAKVCVAPSGR